MHKAQTIREVRVLVCGWSRIPVLFEVHVPKFIWTLPALAIYLQSSSVFIENKHFKIIRWSICMQECQVLYLVNILSQSQLSWYTHLTHLAKGSFALISVFPLYSLMKGNKQYNMGKKMHSALFSLIRKWTGRDTRNFIVSIKTGTVCVLQISNVTHSNAFSIKCMLLSVEWLAFAIFQNLTRA